MFAILCISACNFLSFVRTLSKLFVIFWKFLSEAKLSASGEKMKEIKMSAFVIVNRVQARVKLVMRLLP